MKILLIADVHSNWPALSAIQEPFDACVFLGDAVDYATQPNECVQWLRHNADFCVRGNHDHSVAQQVIVRPGGAFRKMAAGMRQAQLDQLNDTQLTWLARLPVTEYIEIDEQKFLLVHATPRDPMDEYLTDVPDQWEARLQHVDVDFVCCGHTHVPIDVPLENTRVINPGSVGQPRDGDPRAAYAIIENGEVSFRRVEYDIQQTLDHMLRIGIDSATIEQAEKVLKSGGKPSTAKS